MTERTPTQKEAFDLIHQYNQSNSLRKHAYAVEVAMRDIPRKLGEDDEKLGGRLPDQ